MPSDGKVATKMLILATCLHYLVWHVVNNLVIAKAAQMPETSRTSCIKGIFTQDEL